MDAGGKRAELQAQRIAAHELQAQYHRHLDTALTELTHLLGSTRRDLFPTSERKNLSKIVKLANDLGVDISHLVNYKAGVPISWKKGFVLGGGPHKMVDYIADKVGRNIRGVTDVYRRDDNFENAILSALDMKDDKAAREYIVQATKSAFEENADHIPTVAANDALQKSKDPIRRLFHSIERKMLRAGTNVGAVERFRIPDPLVDAKRIRSMGLVGWRQFVTNNPHLFDGDVASYGARFDEPGALTNNQRDLFERFVIESYNYNGYQLLSRSAKAAEDNAYSLALKSNDFASWKTIFDTFGYEKDLGYHMAVALDGAVTNAARETAINMTLGARGKSHAAELHAYMDSANTTNKFFHRRTRAMLSVIANNQIHGNRYMPALNGQIQKFLAEDNSVPFNEFYKEMEKSLGRDLAASQAIRILFREAWRPFTAVKLVAAPILTPLDMLMRSEMSSQYTRGGVGVGTRNTRDGAKTRPEGFIYQIMEDLAATSARAIAYIPSKIAGAATDNVIPIRKMYQSARAANQHLLGLIGSENTRMWGAAQILPHLQPADAGLRQHIFTEFRQRVAVPERQTHRPPARH